jgi:diazepam-binding inhibitor (GABA receptor modulator, acyl-CoA-binding protein)
MSLHLTALPLGDRGNLSSLDLSSARASQRSTREGVAAATAKSRPLPPQSTANHFPRSTEELIRLASTRVSLEEDFQSAQTRVKQLAQTPPPERLLELYSLYKQATEGDVKGSRPGMLDFKGRAKYDAWAARRGTAPGDAMQAYVELVKRLEAQG